MSETVDVSSEEQRTDDHPSAKAADEVLDELAGEPVTRATMVQAVTKMEDRWYNNDTGNGYAEYHIGDASRTAAGIVSQDRDSHGDAYDNHKQIADLWSAFLKFKLDEPIDAWEAAIMMQQVKQSRMQAGFLKFDHFADISGYSDVALYSALMDPETEVGMNEFIEGY